MAKEKENVSVSTKKIKVLKTFKDIGKKHNVNEILEIESKDIDFYKQMEKKKYIKFI